MLANIHGWPFVMLQFSLDVSDVAFGYDVGHWEREMMISAAKCM